MKVNAVDNYRFNNINFESKKKNEIQKPVHSSNPMKAIPVAVLIALSPLNAPVINAQNTAIEQTQPNVLIGNFVYENSTPNNQTCRIDFFGNKGSENFNFIKLNFERNTDVHRINSDGASVKAKRYSNTELKLTKLYTYTLTTNYSNGESEVDTRYYAVGPVKKYIGVAIDPVNNQQVDSSEKPLIKNITEDKYLITKEFYNDLKDLLGDKVEYVNESHTQTRNNTK